MSTDDRRALILEILQAQGSVSVAELAERAGVSASTIRRDLAEMEEMSLLRRTHGRAQALPEGPAAGISRPILPEQSLAHERISQVAASLVRPGQSIVLDSGTIAERIAAQLKSLKGPLTVFTNSVPVALEIAASDHIVTLLTGGQLVYPSLTLTGYPAERTLGEIAADIALLCPDGVDLKRGLFTNDLSAVALNRTMVNVARRVVAVAPADQIDRPALANFAPISEIADIVTTSALSAALQTDLRTQGVELHLA